MQSGTFEMNRSCCALAVGAILTIANVCAQETAPYRFGTAASEAEIAAHNTFVFPDGEGLPAGRGSVTQGAALYRQHCVACHGANGRGGPGGELAGGTQPLTSATPDQTIGTYWPYATTLFDFIRRAMPMTAPGSLSNDNVYALTAYLLAENGIVSKDAELNAATLADISMPNRDGFIWIDAIAP